MIFFFVDVFAADSMDNFNILGSIFFFVLGAVIGSFLNVVIHRVPLGESIVFPNSACPGCGNAIKFYDNIPVLSWLILGGSCRNCRQAISKRYPLVELLTAVLFLAVFWHEGFGWMLPFDLLFVSALVALIFIDAEHMILPDVINYPGLISAFLLRLILPLATNQPLFEDLRHAPLASSFQDQPLWLLSVIGAVLGAAVGGGSLWLIGWIWKRLRGIDAMGLGDVKMMLMVGAFLGWRLTLLTLFLGAFTGALAGIALIFIRGERNLQAQIPFGIFLGIGSLAALFFGEQIINWYLSSFN